MSEYPKRMGCRPRERRSPGHPSSGGSPSGPRLGLKVPHSGGPAQPILNLEHRRLDPIANVPQAGSLPRAVLKLLLGIFGTHLPWRRPRSHTPITISTAPSATVNQPTTIHSSALTNATRSAARAHLPQELGARRFGRYRRLHGRVRGHQAGHPGPLPSTASTRMVRATPPPKTSSISNAGPPSSSHHGHTSAWPATALGDRVHPGLQLIDQLGEPLFSGATPTGKARHLEEVVHRHRPL